MSDLSVLVVVVRAQLLARWVITNVGTERRGTVKGRWWVHLVHRVSVPASCMPLTAFHGVTSAMQEREPRYQKSVTDLIGCLLIQCKNDAGSIFFSLTVPLLEKKCKSYAHCVNFSYFRTPSIQNLFLKRF